MEVSKGNYKIGSLTLEDLLKNYPNFEKMDSTLSTENYLNDNHKDLKRIKEIFLNEENLTKLEESESRALAVFIYSAIGDALDFDSIKANPVLNRCKIGGWTDDTSMALCVADSLLLNSYKFDGIDLRFRFLAWINCGYNNGNPGNTSFGLGGNIATSMREFQKDPTKEYADINNKNNSGNGSLMRLAPVPIAFWQNIEEGIEYADSQSKTTHNGIEAAGCCRLMTHLIIKLINRPKNEDFKLIFDDLKNTFKLKCDEDISVQYLAKSESEPEEMLKNYNENYSRRIEDRDWNWKNKDFNYSPTRLKLHNGEYIGSYCMDALAMALHLSYYSSNSLDPILKAVNMGGDSDTVAAITGQIVGAIYGIQKDTFKLYIDMKESYKIATVASMLYNHSTY